MEYDLRNLPTRILSPYRTAINQAIASKQDMKHGACLFKTKPMLSSPNESGVHSALNIYRLSPVNSRHAECACIIKQGNVRGLSLVVARVDSKGNPALSKPCEMCNSFMAYSGIRYCYYTTDTSLIRYTPRSVTVYPRKFDVGHLKYSRYDYAC